MTKQVKIKFKQILCFHRYAPISIFGDYEDEEGNSYWDKVCTKCGSVTQHYYLGKNILRNEDVTHLKNMGILQ